MPTTVELIDPETLALSFPYDAQVVAQLKRLQSRRWNARRQRWEVHLSHLPDVMRILGLMPRDVPPTVIEAFRNGGWVRCRLKVILGPLEGRLAGSGAPIEALDRETSYFVPGYRFSPKFIARRWDGRRHLLDRRRLTFPAGLWPRIRRVLESHDVPFEVVRARPVRSGAAAPLGCGPVRVPLRPYQQAALDRALKARAGIIQMATGGGKTLLAAHLLRAIDRPAFFFVHTLELLYQSAQVFRDELGIEVGLLGDGQALLRPLTVATAQTAHRAFEQTGLRRRHAALALPPDGAEEPDDPEETGPAERPVQLDEASWRDVREAIERSGAVIFDECHHVPADTFYRVAMHTPAARWRFGLSATPWRDDHQDLLLEAALGPTIHATRCSDLIDAGWLVPPRIFVQPMPPPRRFPRGTRYQDCYRLAIVENQQRNCAIAAWARRWAAQGRSVLILVAHVEHGRRLLELLPEARFAWGGLESAVRRQYLDELERKLRPILIATTLADEGLDLPALEGLILAGGGKSATRAFQRIGRVLRPAPGKREAWVLDFLDEAPYVREHSRARLDLYAQEPRFRVETVDERS